MKEYEQILQNIIEAGLRLRKEGLIVRTWGNISARISDTEFAITPSGRDYSTLTTDDLVIVDIKTGSYDTGRRPSGKSGFTEPYTRSEAISASSSIHTRIMQQS